MFLAVGFDLAKCALSGAMFHGQKKLSEQSGDLFHEQWQCDLCIYSQTTLSADLI